MARKKKVSYNPFKMWGSYGGLLVGLLYFMFNGLVVLGNNPGEIVKFSLYFNIPVFGGIGFFLGWGIHSLIRRFSK